MSVLVESVVVHSLVPRPFLSARERPFLPCEKGLGTRLYRSCMRAFVRVCVCVCAEVTEVYDTMSCLPIVSDRAVTEESKYFKLGRQPHEFFLT